MDIDLLHNNHMYYDGFEGEEEVEITLINDQSLSIHFWIGYMDDILSNPDLQGKGWAGFTKALFSNDPTPDNCYDPHEYLHDIKQYQDADFNEEESHLVRASIDNHILGICNICWIKNHYSSTLTTSRQQSMFVDCCYDYLLRLFYRMRLFK